MICFLRRARRCFVVTGAGAGVLTAWCIGGAVRGVTVSELVACLTLANESPFMTNLDVPRNGVRFKRFRGGLGDAGPVSNRRTDFGAKANLLTRLLRLL